MRTKKVKEGDPLPEFEVISCIGKNKTKEDFIGVSTLFFIYPKNDTSSCTKEAKDFSDYNTQFLNYGVEVYGVSKDNIESHKKFINKHSLNIELLSDERLSFIKAIGSWVEKSMYGKKYMGVERTSVLVSKDGKVLKIWEKVRVKGHVQDVFDFLEQKKI